MSDPFAFQLDSSHRLMFIRDIKTAKEQNLDLEESQRHYNIRGNVFRKIRINGILILKKQTRLSEPYKDIAQSIWIDDGTDVIQVLIPYRLCCRPDADQLVISSSVTIIGTVEKLNDDRVVLCGGFHVETDHVAEIYHWLQVIALDKTAETDTPSSQHTSLHHKAFQGQNHTLSSQPSPIRGPVQWLKANDSPIRAGNDDGGDTDNSNYWHLSPEHPFASSTPIRKTMTSGASPGLGSPLRFKVVGKSSPSQSRNATNASDDDNEDDDFGFGDDSLFDAVDFDALEQEAIRGQQTQQGKRPFSQMLDD